MTQASPSFLVRSRLNHFIFRILIKKNLLVLNCCKTVLKQSYNILLATPSRAIYKLNQFFKQIELIHLKLLPRCFVKRAKSLPAPQIAILKKRKIYRKRKRKLTETNITSFQKRHALFPWFNQFYRLCQWLYQYRS